MTNERRYRDQEIREIFDLATKGDESGTPTLSTNEGLTLAQLQDVGREVGLAPERVADAAMSLDAHGEVLPRGTTMGLPTSVGRTVALPRALTDREWELLVTELRATFHAKGHVTSHGSLREWSNGNLHAFVEPTDTGHRLRMTTVKGDAMGRAFAGGFLVAFAVMLLVILLGKEDPGVRWVIPVFFSLLGGGFIGSNVMGLPRWALEREQQMEHIAGRVKALIGEGEPQDA